ncbi:MAG: AEC family transporter [Kiloniellales bacterium]|nr:AEC family transporter [Kiloniellales bacterium]
MLSQIFTVIAPVFFCAAIGLVWAKRGIAYETVFITRLVTNVGFPSLVFVGLVETEVDWATFAIMASAAVASTLAFAAIGALALRLAGLELRVFLPAMTFANTGNMGLSLCLLAFGPEGLALAIPYFTVTAVLGFTLGPAIASRSSSLSAPFKMPLVWATLAALAVLAAGLSMPLWLTKTLDLIGGFAIPLMLITLGVSLAQLQMTGMARSFALSVLRLAMGFAVGVAFAYALGLEGTARGVLIIECAMPVAVFNFLYASIYNTRPAEVAGVIVVSTALSFLTLPALLWYVL